MYTPAGEKMALIKRDEHSVKKITSGFGCHSCELALTGYCIGCYKESGRTICASCCDFVEQTARKQHIHVFSKQGYACDKCRMLLSLSCTRCLSIDNKCLCRKCCKGRRQELPLQPSVSFFTTKTQVPSPSALVAAIGDLRGCLKRPRHHRHNNCRKNAHVVRQIWNGKRQLMHIQRHKKELGVAMLPVLCIGHEKYVQKRTKRVRFDLPS